MKVLPDFNTWKYFVKDSSLGFDQGDLLDIDPIKVGLLRSSAKYMYPCDDSLIRVEKHYVGGRRVGASLVIKDNLSFGIRERPESFKEKTTIEEDEVLRNREAWDGLTGFDKRCELWLEFENGVKLLVEMADKIEPNFKDIPLQVPEDLVH
jgi:hypothetical protein